MSKVEKLISVQEIDKEIYGYKRDLSRIPEKIQELKQKLESDDVALMRFGFSWLRFSLFGE